MNVTGWHEIPHCRLQRSVPHRGTHAAHNSQLISLQAKQHSESAGQRALIEANQEPQSKVRPGSLLLGADINRHLRSHSISRFHQGLHERLSSLSFTALWPTSLEESRRCQRACPRPVQMFPTGNSASEKATKRPRGFNSLFPCAQPRKPH